MVLALLLAQALLALTARPAKLNNTKKLLNVYNAMSCVTDALALAVRIVLLVLQISTS